jgi:hypothetical protein
VRKPRRVNFVKDCCWFGFHPMTVRQFKQNIRSEQGHQFCTHKHKLLDEKYMARFKAEEADTVPDKPSDSAGNFLNASLDREFPNRRVQASPARFYREQPIEPDRKTNIVALPQRGGSSPSESLAPKTAQPRILPMSAVRTG